jgi:hypothetical protein
MRLTVEIPLKCYLLKFIAKNHDINPFKLSTGKCHLSSIILDPLKKEGSIKPPLRGDDTKYVNLICSIPLGEQRFFFDESSILRINQRLDSMFDQQLCDMVSITNERKGDIFARVKQFTDYYNIGEDDLKFETVIKMYYRARYPRNSVERETNIKIELMRNQQLSFFDN